MKKYTNLFGQSSILVLFIFALFAVFHTTHAYSLSVYTPLGGIIQNSKAQNVQDIEDSNYRCVVPGSSFSVNPVGGGKSVNLLVSAGTQSSTTSKAMPRQYFLGLYQNTMQTISCIFQGYPPSTTTTTLNMIRLYGTSK